MYIYILFFYKSNEGKIIPYYRGNNNMKDSGFLIENTGEQKEMVQQFSTAERKELSIQSLISSENILHELWKNQDFLKLRKIKINFH